MAGSTPASPSAEAAAPVFSPGRDAWRRFRKHKLAVVGLVVLALLVLGAGLRREWLDAGVEARGLPTWWGPLDVSVRLDGGCYRVRASGGAAPPGGFAWQLPRPFVQE